MMRRFAHLLENSNKLALYNSKFNKNFTSFISQHAFASKTQKATGVCKWWNNLKGFGFITLDDGSGEVFVHQTQIQAEGFRSLAEGEPVEFNVETNNDGKKHATNVTGPNGAAVQGAPKREGRSDRGNNDRRRDRGDRGDRGDRSFRDNNRRRNPNRSEEEDQ